MTGKLGLVRFVIVEIALVNQHVNIANLLDVIGIRRCSGIGNVRQRFVFPINPIANRAARMLQGKVCQHATIDERDFVGEDLRVEGRLYRK